MIGTDGLDLIARATRGGPSRRDLAGLASFPLESVKIEVSIKTKPPFPCRSAPFDGTMARPDGSFSMPPFFETLQYDQQTIRTYGLRFWYHCCSLGTATEEGG